MILCQCIRRGREAKEMDAVNAVPWGILWPMHSAERVFEKLVM
jgi:hypothetical protein